MKGFPNFIIYVCIAGAFLAAILTYRGSPGAFAIGAIISVALLIFGHNVKQANSRSKSDKKIPESEQPKGENDGSSRPVQAAEKTRKSPDFRPGGWHRNDSNASVFVMIAILVGLFVGGFYLVGKGHPIAGYVVIAVSLLLIPVSIFAAIPKPDEDDNRTPIQRAIVADKVLNDVEKRFFRKRDPFQVPRPDPDPDPDFDKRVTAPQTEEEKREASVARALERFRKKIFNKWGPLNRPDYLD